jgi:hypothetical protein
MRLFNKLGLKTTMKALFLFVVSGWRMTSVFGYPPKFDKNNMNSYLIANGDGTLIDHCQYHGKRNGKIKCIQAGIGCALLPDFWDIKMWKKLDNTKRWVHWGCK